MGQEVPSGGDADRADDRQARWGRDRDDGFVIGRFVQTPPLFFTRDHHPLWLFDLYRGRSLFLICGGPSVKSLRMSRLRQPGIVTMGVNNSARTFRPNLWCEVDSPHNFIKSVWMDPLITKFVPIDHVSKRIFDSNTWSYTGEVVGDCPNVIYFKRNERFNAAQFLWEDSLNWGNHTKWGGGRSVMLPAVRIAFLLGFRRLFLLGADFGMDAQQKYHFEQDRHAGSVKGNNKTYEQLNTRFAELRPLFEAEGFEVLNCNPASNLTAFEHVRYRDALKLAAAELDVDWQHERTFGLYEHGGIREKITKHTAEGDKLTAAATKKLKLAASLEDGQRKRRLDKEAGATADKAARELKLAAEAQAKLDVLANWRPPDGG